MLSRLRLRLLSCGNIHQPNLSVSVKVEQPFLGPTGTLIFLVVVSAFPTLTTDLYLPALPTMVDTLNATQAMVNLTLSIYFVAYALG